MNLPYPVPERTNRSMLWILTAVLLLTSLIVAIRTSVQDVSVNVAHPVTISANKLIPEAAPVPMPVNDQPSPYPPASATPEPLGAQVRPLPQPVPTPPAGQ